MIDPSRLRLGLFLLAGLTLFIAGLFAFGLRRAFEPTVQFYTYFDEPVQGLEPGAALRFKGVTLGKVKRITIAGQRIRVEFTCEISSMNPGEQPGDRDWFRQTIRDEVKKGLRAQLEYTGITGLKFVQLDYRKAEELEVDGPGDDDRFIPSKRSALAGAMEKIDRSISRLASLDIAGLATEAQKSFANANRILESKAVGQIVSNLESSSFHLAELSSRLDARFNDERLAAILSQAEKLLASANESSLELKKQVAAMELEAVSKQARATLAQLSSSTRNIEEPMRDAALSLAQAGKDISAFRPAAEKNLAASSLALTESSEEVQLTLKRLRDTLSALDALLTTLERDPGSLVRGKEAE
ncbi:MAG: hypothetical protein RL095_3538 [Verrucomicrobiota bacterium]|jgi:ABC-type transporter Mla subunit MlaD